MRDRISTNRNFKRILHRKKSGLIKISESNSNHVIIFVHGFNSSSIGTWGIKNDVFWPADLAHEVQCSAYCFQYNNNALSSAFNSPLSFRDVAERLVNDIVDLSCDKITFVSHSFGGIVVKEAINFCARSNDPGIKAILDKIYGFLPISCPNRGSWFAWALAVLGRLSSANSVALRRGVGELAECHDKFLVNISRLDHLNIMTITESARTYFLFRVERDDATIAGRNNWPSQLNHSGVSKNLHPQGQEYKAILEFISNTDKIEIDEKFIVI